MTELLDAVDALTKPTTSVVVQDIYETVMVDGRPKTDDNGDMVREKTGQTRKVRLEHAPLLDRLEEAITSTMSRQGGGGSEKHARNIVDSDALFEFMRITAQITDWCAIVGIRATRNAGNDLRRWYAARLATNPEHDDWYTDKLHLWARVIEAKLNAPRSWELRPACPVCTATTWVDTIDENGVITEVTRNRPVLVEYWPDSIDVVNTAHATCRACGHEWAGKYALNHLAVAIDNADTPEPQEETTPV